MKNYLLVSVLGLSLVACEKADQANNVMPTVTPFTSSQELGTEKATLSSSAAAQRVWGVFGQKFSLAYKQKASLRTAGSQELLITVKDLSYTLCPKNANCLVADIVSPILSVTDAQGRSQQVQLLAPGNPRQYNSNWVDTTSVRANGRRYLLTYNTWKIAAGIDHPQRKDISVVLSVTKPTCKSL